MAKVKKTIEVSKKDLEEIINSFYAAYVYFTSECAHENRDELLKCHYRYLAKKYKQRVNKYIKIYRKIFGTNVQYNVFK